MFIGALPALALLMYQSAVTSGTADAMFSADFFRWFMVAAGLGALWVIVLAVQIARKTDPVYARLAGTAVLKHSGVPPALP
jgi:hypothetical protein